MTNLLNIMRRKYASMCSDMFETMLDRHQKLTAMVRSSLSTWWNLWQTEIAIKNISFKLYITEGGGEGRKERRLLMNTDGY